MSDQVIIRRTTYETYEVDREVIAVLLGSGQSDMPGTRLEQLEAQIIELFESHNGSAYGEAIFGSLDQDSGLELFSRDEDGNNIPYRG